MIAFVLIVLDIAAILCSYQIAYLTRTVILPGFIAFPFPEPLPLALVNPFWLPLIFLFFYWFEQLYSRKYPFWEEIRQICKASLLASLAGFAIVSIGKLSDEVSRSVLIFTFLNSLWIVPVFRLIGKRAVFKTGAGKRKIIIIGAGLTGELFLKSILKEKTIGYEVVGFLDDDESKKNTVVNNYKVLGKISEIDSFLAPGTEVVVAIPGMTSEKMVQLVNLLQKKVKKVSFVPDLFGIPFFDGDMDFFFENQLLVLSIRNNLNNKSNKIIKKIFDIVISVLALFVILPVIGVIAVIIKLGSKGSAFYVTDRVGRKSGLFKCYKFRTMYLNGDEILREALSKSTSKREEWETYFKLKDDPRLTGFGRFLRRYSLDELPQIANILKGDMSLIGPRPYLPREKEAIGDYLESITQVAPGVTGLWQVSGRNNMTFKERVIMDSWYIQNWSLWLDITILIKTIGAVIKKEGAY
jgi:undecaprenyl-phosphate galactose phosphotransferase